MRCLDDLDETPPRLITTPPRCPESVVSTLVSAPTPVRLSMALGHWPRSPVARFERRSCGGPAGLEPHVNPRCKRGAPPTELQALPAAAAPTTASLCQAVLCQAVRCQAVLPGSGRYRGHDSAIRVEVAASPGPLTRAQRTPGPRRPRKSPARQNVQDPQAGGDHRAARSRRAVEER